MARRRNPDDILGARGYNARVLWPRYTPGGGVNSGSEPPIRPSNTLQSNQSNLILTQNPPDSAVYIHRNSRGQTRNLTHRQARSPVYADYVELRPVTGSTSPYYRRNPHNFTQLDDSTGDYLPHSDYRNKHQPVAETEEEARVRYYAARERERAEAKAYREALERSPVKGTPVWRKKNPDDGEQYESQAAKAYKAPDKIAVTTKAGETKYVTQAQYDAFYAKSDSAPGSSTESTPTQGKQTPFQRALAYHLLRGKRNNPKREIGDSMQARRKSKSCSGAMINPGDSITKTASGWERTDLL